MEIMDGEDSPYFHYFKSLFLRGIIELRRHVDNFVKIIEIMSRSKMTPLNKVQIFLAFLKEVMLQKLFRISEKGSLPIKVKSNI
jgi:hypothetical protein